MGMSIDIALHFVTGRTFTPDQAIGQLYTMYESHAGMDGCTQQKADDFVKWFRAQVLQEAKDPGVKVSRVAALREIRDFIAAGGAQCTAFPHVDRYRFAVELALRVRKPRTIAQNYANADAGVNLCGPNMMIIDFAKRKPVEFVRYAIGLADQGVGTLWHTTVTPEAQFRRTDPPQKLAPVDFVTLGSLRYTDAYYLEFLDTIKSLTKPARLTSWLTQAGFSEVRDQTMVSLGVVASALDKITSFAVNSDRGALGLQRGLQNLQYAALELTQGRLVIMLGSVMLAGMMVKKGADFRKVGATMHLPERPDGFVPDLHWMLLKKLTANSTTVTVHLYTYGRSVINTFHTRDFLLYYNGYVSGRHPATPIEGIPLLTA
jgi:hypothetical protein